MNINQATMMIDAAAAGFRVHARMGSVETEPGAYGGTTYPRLFTHREVDLACRVLREHGRAVPDRADWAAPVQVDDSDDVRAALRRYMRLPASHRMVIRVESAGRPEITITPGDIYIREMARQCREEGRELSVRALVQEIIWAHYDALHARDWNIATPLAETVVALERFVPAPQEDWAYGIYGGMEEVGRATVSITVNGREERELRNVNIYFTGLCDRLCPDEPEPGARGAALLSRDEFIDAGREIGRNMCYDPPRPVVVSDDTPRLLNRKEPEGQSDE